MTIDPEPPPEVIEPTPADTLVPVIWDGLDLNEGYRDDGMLVIVTNVEGWYGTPVLDGHDLDLALTDGALAGVKTIHERLVTITGIANGPRLGCLLLSRQLAGMAADRLPVPLVVGEDGRALTAAVRAGTEQMTHEWTGPVLFTYQVTLTAHDPRLYSDGWEIAELTLGGSAATGRTYPRTYSWQYGAPTIDNSARLDNPGNVPAPVWAVYTGPLSATTLTDGRNTIRIAALVAGQVLTVATESLVAVAPGGATRASYVLAGSSAMTVPANSIGTWSLYGSGTGYVELQWRAAYL